MTARELIEEIRKQIAADDAALVEARRRRDAVRAAAQTFSGALRTFRSGSLATGFVNHPVADADCGLVLDRRCYTNLGPDGGGELPYTIVDRIHDHIRPVLRLTDPAVSIRKMKRGLLVGFNAPLDAEQDPTVDLVVALNRREDDALWIPNLDRNRWDPSHPEKHVDLFTSGSPELRRTRAQVARLAKAQVKQFSPPTLSSFNVAALVWEAIQQPEPLFSALRRLFAHAAATLPWRLTCDPAGVSDPIPIPDDLDTEVIAHCLQQAASGLEQAIEAGNDEEKVLLALAKVFPNYLEKPSVLKERSRMASKLRRAAPVALSGLGTVPPTTSYGGRGMSRRRRVIGKPPSGPWYGDFKQRRGFERGFCPAAPGRSGRACRYRGALGYMYRLLVDVPTYGVRKVSIFFPRKYPMAPSVFADGPHLSRHRFRDGSLCMWYHSDPPERRWRFSDGLPLLVGHTELHLFKESWFIDTGEWLGAEILHQPGPSAS